MERVGVGGGGGEKGCGGGKRGRGMGIFEKIYRSVSNSGAII